MKIGPSYLCFQNRSKIVKNGVFGECSLFLTCCKIYSESTKNAKNCSKLKMEKMNFFTKNFPRSKIIHIFAVEFDWKRNDNKRIC
nr:MAG TPA: hypothetical protein [Caudoviricetes sp.]